MTENTQNYTNMSNFCTKMFFSYPFSRCPRRPERGLWLAAWWKPPRHPPWGVGGGRNRRRRGRNMEDLQKCTQPVQHWGSQELFFFFLKRRGVRQKLSPPPVARVWWGWGSKSHFDVQVKVVKKGENLLQREGWKPAAAASPAGLTSDLSVNFQAAVAERRPERLQISGLFRFDFRIKGDDVPPCLMTESKGGAARKNEGGEAAVHFCF